MAQNHYAHKMVGYAVSDKLTMYQLMFARIVNGQLDRSYHRSSLRSGPNTLIISFQ